MKIKIDRERFLTPFQIAATVAPARSPKPILQNVKLEVSETGIDLIATDMEVGIRSDVSGIEVSSPGSVVLPVGRFGSILRESMDEKLCIETDGQNTLIKGQHSEFRLPAENPDEFPAIETYQESAYHVVPARLMKELVRRTLFATDTDSSRYALGGVLLEFEPDKIVAVGTDGRRLAKMEGPAHGVNGHPQGATMTIVPSRSMQLIDRALSDSDAEIQVSARSNDVFVKTPHVTLYSRLVEGRFPKWRDVLPTREDGARIEMSTGPVFGAVRQAAVVASDESRGLDLKFANGTLSLSANTAEVGQSHVEIPIPYEGDDIKITLDHRFVADFMKVLDLDKTFVLDVKNNEEAAVFSTDDGYAYVVMPLSRDRKR